MAKNLPNATQLTAALQAIGLPGGRQLQFLKAHYQAPGKALTAARLAKAAKYQSWRGVNLQYGRLAGKIARVLKAKDAGLSLLVEFIRPKSVTNDQWVLVMRPEFARALEKSGWVT